VYLNPKAHGAQHARTLTAQVFTRLGLAAAWNAIASGLRPDDELQIIALDLTAENNARVKLYVRHQHDFIADFERAASIATDNIGSDIRTFVAELFPAGESWASRPATTMYIATLEDTRIDASFCLATYPFLGNDAVALERITSLLRRFGLSTGAYTRAVRALAPGESSAQRGLHNYVSFQNRDGARRVTVYLTPRMYLHRLGPIGFDPLVAWPTPTGRLAAQS
jgi:hypothetical protein